MLYAVTWLYEVRPAFLVEMSGTVFCNVSYKWENFVESSWNVMAHGDARVGKWRGNWRMEWVASTLHSTSEHGVSSITTADTHTSAVISRLNWPHPPGRFKWTRPFGRKTKSGFCACAITFQTQSSNLKGDNTLPILRVTFDRRCCIYFELQPRRTGCSYLVYYCFACS